MKLSKKPQKFKIISLFSGCGGSDLGMLGKFDYLGKRYNRLPTEIVFAIDNNTRAVETYNANFDKSAVLMDISNCDISNVPNADIIVGGFPCQSFSTVNPTKNPFDERGFLYKEMGRFLNAKKPIAFIAENVKGLARLNKGKILQSVLEEFRKYGYKVVWEIINAADYGVPQKRERVFIVGIRNDLNKEYKFPKPTHSQFEQGLKPKWIPLNRVIDTLENVEKKYYFSERAVNGMKMAKNNMKRGLAQDLSQPCLTITAHLAKVSLNSRDPVLLLNKQREIYRRFTPLEAARIQSFPDTFKFIGSEADAYRQIGNAIAPVVMWHITQSLISQLKKSLEETEEARSLDSDKKPQVNIPQFA